jgi:L-seryl-tRNA(Ser) seleniumtransferase
VSSPARPPRMDHLLDAARREGLLGRYGREATREALRRALDEARSAWRKGTATPAVEDLLSRCREVLAGEYAAPLRRVLNATGVVLHTNLGRAPICRAHLREATDLLSGYVDLEMDVAEGGRGHRDSKLEAAFRDLLGTEYGLVATNNNAGALLLALRTLSAGREAVVSRGELVEIGGGFRLPEVMAASGAILREVGTTNRTRLADYAAAVGPSTGLLLKVHPSNFRIRGFTCETSLEELASLGRERGVPVVMDLGSGLLAPEGSLDLGDEPSVRSCLGAGPDVVCFSADKLLGASQAGILLARREICERLRRDPLLRALRVDKVSYLLLGRAVEAYRRGAWLELPAVAALCETEEALKRRARALAAAVRRAAPGRFELAITVLEGRAGGGTAPLHPLPSPALRVRPVEGSVEALEEFMRRGDPAVVGVLHEGAYHLHLRTLLPREIPDLVRRLAEFRGVRP